MKKSTLALSLMSINALASSFSDYVTSVKESRPEDADQISKVALLTQDIVIHYEKAVLLGTSKEYQEQTKIIHFKEFLKASDMQCEDINLTSCIYDLICEDEVKHNLKTSMMPCD